jgi:Uma2 family endonuclease
MLEVLENSTLNPVPQVTGITFEEYLVKYDGQHAEWIDGNVVTYMSASYTHQDIVGFLEALLRVFVEENNLGVICTGPMSMRLDGRGREPDVFFVSNENLENIKTTYLDGAADLIIEVISPESRGRDRGDKFYEYEAAGVKEYWLIDYERKQAEFYVLGENGIYKLTEPDTNQIYHSKVIKNLNLNVKWLWQDKLPTLLDVLKEWKMI